MSISDLEREFEALLPSEEKAWDVSTLVPNRVHAGKGSAGNYTLFIEGDQQSFGSMPNLRGIDYSDSVTAVPSKRRFSAVRMTSYDPVIGNRIMLHIAYELVRRLAADPAESNADLIRGVEWVLTLLGQQDAQMTAERQRGLVGELLLLRRLLKLCREEHRPASVAIRRWWGHMPAMRDFAADGVAIEAKTTGLPARVHHVGSLSQLEPTNPVEAVYLFSVGIRMDPTATRKLPDFVSDVEAQCVDERGNEDSVALSMLRQQLENYGYRRDQEMVYRSGVGFLNPHLASALFRAADLDRLTMDSFVGRSLPREVVGVSYNLEVKREPLPEDATIRVFKQLLASAETSGQ